MAIKKQSRSRSASSSAGSKPTQQDKDLLQQLLPGGWGSYFSPFRAGKHWGLRIVCPHCSETPPPGLKYGHRRWRWLSVHIAQHKKR